MLLAFLCMACGREVVEVSTNTDSVIYPDYVGVTVPCNVAPLNFHYTAGGIRKAHTTVRCNDLCYGFSGKDVIWELSQWKEMLASADCDTIRFHSEISLRGGMKETHEWEIYVSQDRIDPYL